MTTATQTRPNEELDRALDEAERQFQAQYPPITQGAIDTALDEAEAQMQSTGARRVPTSRPQAPDVQAQARTAGIDTALDEAERTYRAVPSPVTPTPDSDLDFYVRDKPYYGLRLDEQKLTRRTSRLDRRLLRAVRAEMQRRREQPEHIQAEWRELAEDALVHTGGDEAEATVLMAGSGLKSPDLIKRSLAAVDPSIQALAKTVRKDIAVPAKTIADPAYRAESYRKLKAVRAALAARNWDEIPSTELGETALEKSILARASIARMENIYKQGIRPEFVMVPEAMKFTGPKDWRERGPKGVWETLRRKEGYAVVPILRDVMKLAKAGDLLRTINNLQADEYEDRFGRWDKALDRWRDIHPAASKEWVKQGTVWRAEEQRASDLKVVENFLLTQQEMAERGMTTWGQIAEGAIEMAPYMLEFLLTAGLVRTMSAPARAAGRTLLRHCSNRITRFGVKTLTRGTVGMIHAATRTAILPTAAAQAFERMLPRGMELTPHGQLIITEAGDSPGKAFMRAYADVFAEMFSEESGAVFGKAGRRVLAKFPGAQKAYSRFARRFWKRIPARWKQGFAKGGYTGLLTEMPEERLKDIITATLNIPPPTKGETNEEFFVRMNKAIFPGWQQLFVEFMVLSIPGAIRAASGLIGPRAAPEAPPPGPVVPPEYKPPITPLAEEIRSIDAALDRAEEQLRRQPPAEKKARAERIKAAEEPAAPAEAKWPEAATFATAPSGEGAIIRRPSIAGKALAEESYTETQLGDEQFAAQAERMFPDAPDVEAGKVHRFYGINLEEAQRRKGLGKLMILDALAQRGERDWYYNSQASVRLGMTMLGLSDLGMIEMWSTGAGGPRRGLAFQVTGTPGPFMMRLTEKGQRFLGQQLARPEAEVAAEPVSAIERRARRYEAQEQLGRVRQELSVDKPQIEEPKPYVTAPGTKRRAGRRARTLEKEIVSYYEQNTGEFAEAPRDARMVGDEEGQAAFTMDTQFAGKIPGEVLDHFPGHKVPLRLRPYIRGNQPYGLGEETVSAIGGEALIEHAEAMAAGRKGDVARAIAGARAFAESVGDAETVEKVDRYRALLDIEAYDWPEQQEILAGKLPAEPVPTEPTEREIPVTRGEIRPRETAAPTPAEDIAAVERLLPPNMATSKQKAHAHILARKAGLLDKEGAATSAYRRVAYDATGASSMVEMTQADAVKFVAALRVLAGPTPKVGLPAAPQSADSLTESEVQRLRKITRSETVYSQLRDYVNRLGELPDEPGLRKAYIRNLESAGRSMRRRGKRIERAKRRGKEVNDLNPWSSSRYSVSQAELRTGVPLQAEFTDVVHTAAGASLEAQGIFQAKLKAIRKSLFTIALHRTQNEQIADWLFEADQTKRSEFWGKLDAESRELATMLHEFLQNEAANEIREQRWRIWDRIDRRAGNTISWLESQLERIPNKDLPRAKYLSGQIADLQRQIDNAKPPNAPDTALEEGRKAKVEGRLTEWIAGEKWGTRKFYYMSEGESQSLVDQLLPAGISETLEEEIPTAGAAPAVKPAGLKTRRGKPARIRGRSVISAVLHHFERAKVANQTSDALEGFWRSFEESGPSREDIRNMREFMRSALGMPRHASLPTRVARTGGRVFWRMYFITPLKAGWYFVRNIHQNIAFAATQLSLVEALEAGVKLATGRANPQMAKDFADQWKEKISQRKRIGRQFLLQEEGNIRQEAGNRAVMLMDAIAQIPLYSDEINRIQPWGLAHQIAYDNVQAYSEGWLPYSWLSRALRLATLHAAQRIELQQMLNRKEYARFVARYAELKTENIHFKYETAFRSAAEQTPAGRAWMGLMTFPRGTYEIAYQNSVKPLCQGIVAKDGNQIYQSLIALMLLWLGSWLARRLLYAITGRKAYDPIETVVRYTPLTPGAGKINDLFDDISAVLYRSERQDWSVRQTADALMGIGVNNLEFFIPACDTCINYYEVKNDVKGVRLWRLVKKEALAKYLEDTGKPFRKADREWQENIQHVIFGGAEEGAAEKGEVGAAAPSIRRRQRTRRGR